MLVVVAVVFHKYVPPPLAVSVVVCPMQRLVLPDIAATGSEFTTTVAVAVLEQLPFETVTV